MDMSKQDWMALSGFEMKNEGYRWKRAMQRLLDERIAKVQADHIKSLRRLGKPALSLVGH